jgi:hypothetical protein
MHKAYCRCIECLERTAQELEADPTKHALYQAFIQSGKSFLEIWTPTNIEKGRPQ